MPRTILFVDHTARMGGGEIALLNLVRSLDRARYTPIVLLFAAGPLHDLLVLAGISTRVVPLAADIGEVRKDSLRSGAITRLRLVARTLAFTWRVRRVIRSIRPALVHTNSLKSDIIGGIAARSARVPVIWHVRDRIADDYLPRPAVRVFRWLAGWLPRMVIANSNATLSTLNPNTHGTAIPSGIEDRGYSVVHDGISNADFESPQRDETASSIVGLVGRLTRWKGQHIFIEAIRRLHPQFPAARFQIIGSAMFGEEAYEQELRVAVASHQLDQIVEFTGFRSDIHRAVGILDVVVHASITGEPFGQVIVEGMMAAKAVVATNGGGVPEIVVDGETGILVPMGDVDAMADAIARLLEDPALRLSMGRRGRERAMEHFVIEKTAERVQAVYDRVLGHP